jgi:hypothetical protein
MLEKLFGIGIEIVITGDEVELIKCNFGILSEIFLDGKDILKW